MMHFGEREQTAEKNRQKWTWQYHALLDKVSVLKKALFEKSAKNFPIVRQRHYIFYHQTVTVFEQISIGVLGMSNTFQFDLFFSLVTLVMACHVHL